MKLRRNWSLENLCLSVSHEQLIDRKENPIKNKRTINSSRSENAHPARQHFHLPFFTTEEWHNECEHSIAQTYRALVNPFFFSLCRTCYLIGCLTGSINDFLVKTKLSSRSVSIKKKDGIPWHVDRRLIAIGSERHYRSVTRRKENIQRHCRMRNNLKNYTHQQQKWHDNWMDKHTSLNDGINNLDRNIK